MANRIWLGALLVLANQPLLAQEKITKETVEYASSADKTAKLKYDVAYQANGKTKPLVVVMHGYSGSRVSVKDDLEILANKGVFAVAPDTRGCGDSGGKWDSSGLDIHDILDAVMSVLTKYPKEIDPRNRNIVGYSGGGGNAIACSVRFPDLFRTHTSFFGISDYGGWNLSKGRPDCNEKMEKGLGGGPEKLPEVYASRNFIPAAGNVKGAIRFFWDEEEKQCPPKMVEDFIGVYKKAGGENSTVHLSKKTDEHRWIHGYRGTVKSLNEADDIYLKDVFAKKFETPELPPKGTLVVCGYLVTKHFQVWIEDGQVGRVTVKYDLTGEKPVFEVTENTGKHKVKIELVTPLKDLPK